MFDFSKGDPQGLRSAPQERQTQDRRSWSTDRDPQGLRSAPQERQTQDRRPWSTDRDPQGLRSAPQERRRGIRLLRANLRSTVFALLFFLAAPAACDQLRTQHLKVANIRVGGVPVRAELALTQETRRRGLMYRGSLGYNEGMLFVFPKAKMQSFWMKNTLIPLDIGYFDEQGFLINVHTMEPDDGKKTYPSTEPALYALEMNKGWFKKNGLRKYAKLELPDEIKGL